MNPGSNTESYPAFAHIGLRENRKNPNQGTAPKITHHLLVLGGRKTPEKPQPGNLLRPGFEPGPPGFTARRADRYSTDVDLITACNILEWRKRFRKERMFKGGQLVLSKCQKPQSSGTNSVLASISRPPARATSSHRGNELLSQRNYKQLVPVAAGSVCLSIFQDFFNTLSTSCPSMRMLLQDDARPEQAHCAITPAVIAEVDGVILGNRRITMKELRRLVRINHGSVHVIATKHLHYRKICAQWDSHQLTKEQKQTEWVLYGDTCNDTTRKCMHLCPVL
ncbi:hypothetical protein ANN_03169 [Periplaneta americana]|uniref:Uncharacterized protein n=1 Tax=Periplaneta americana TaxID=6978 RepID=A0ABQ8U267_PERAM|nr:hypothetical protein ANN_03169 [Periplaneta americana]